MELLIGLTLQLIIFFWSSYFTAQHPSYQLFFVVDIRSSLFEINMIIAVVFVSCSRLCEVDLQEMFHLVRSLKSWSALTPNRFSD